MSIARARSKGRLYVVATPIGNLKDITLRALEILREADLILCEDTRTTRKLLTHYGISGKRLLSLYKDNEPKRLPRVLESLDKGLQVALVSEAGTPGISDPGALVVAEARKAGFPVVPIPGPSALTAALSLSGIDLSKGFLFLGFLPRRKKERQKLLSEIRNLNRPLMFFEAPHRLKAALSDILESFGDQEILLFRELTKIHEEVSSLRVSEALELFRKREPRGEFVILIKAPEKENLTLDQSKIRSLLEEKINQGMSLKEAVKAVSEEWSLSKKEVYALAVRSGLSARNLSISSKKAESS